jgi:hypothetical protein
MMRGYTMIGCLAYIDERYDEATRKRLYDGLSPDVRTNMSSYKRVEWYPRAHLVDFLRGIAAVHGSDDEAAFRDIVACGQSVAKDAASTFLRLLMKILTPVLFAKKIPDIWARDSQGGKMTADASRVGERLLVMHLTDVEGFDHIGPLAVGWISFAMTAMGKKGVQGKAKGWSLATPGPRDLQIDMTWQS